MPPARRQAALNASSASKSVANSRRMCLRQAGALFLYRKTHTAANRAAPARHARCRGPKWEKPSPLRDGFNCIEKTPHWFPLCRALCAGPHFLAFYYTAVFPSLQAGYSVPAAQTGFARHTRPLPAGRAVRLCSTLPQTGCFFPCAAPCREQAVLSRAPGRRARD